MPDLQDHIIIQSRSREGCGLIVFLTQITQMILLWLMHTDGGFIVVHTNMTLSGIHA